MGNNDPVGAAFSFFTGAGTDLATEYIVDVFITFILIVIAVVEVAIAYQAYAALQALGEFKVDSIANKEIQEIPRISATEGTPMYRSCGRRARVRGVVIWQGEVQHSKEEVVVQEVETEVDRYKVDVAIAWGQAFGGTNGLGRISDIIMIIADGKVLWKKNKESQFDDRWTDVTHYYGSTSQNADAVIEEAAGSNRVPGFRDTAYTVIEGWRLEDFGNRIPLTISAIIQPDDTPYTLADAIADVWNRIPGRDADDDLDVSGVTGKNVIKEEDGVRQFQGFQHEGLVAPAELIQNFTQIFDLTARHSDGRLVFLDRGDEPVVEVSADHLGCSVGDAPTSRPIEIADLDNRKRPTAVTINFLAKDARYQRSSETYRRNSDIQNGENAAVINYEGVLRRAQARRVAKRRLAEAYRVSQSAFISGLPADYMVIEAGDVLACPMGGQVYYIRAQEITVGADYLIEVRGVVEQVRAGEDEILTTAGSDLGTDADDDDSTTDGSDNDDPEDGEDGGYTPPLVRKVPMNLPPIFDDAEVPETGIHYAHCAEDPQATWKGAQAYAKFGGTSYDKFKGPFSECSIGLATTVLNDTTAWHFFDPLSTVTVQMLHGAPSSATREEVEGGVNWIAIGSLAGDDFEVCGFTTATPVASTTTDLTGLSCGMASAMFVKTGGTSFVTLGVVVGQYVRIEGLEEPENQDLFREVLAVSADSITLSEDAGALVDEGPLGGTVAISLEVGSSKYILSGMFRGLRDTFDHIDEHAAGDLVVFLKPTQFKFVEFPKGKIKKDIQVKAVPKGSTLGDVLSEEITFQGETLRPFRPCWLLVEREYIGLDVELEPEYDITISWVHRTRFPFPDPTTEQVPHAELDHEGKQDKYVIELYSDAGYTTLFRTINVTAPDDHDNGDTEGRRSVVYTTTQQDNDVTDDGITKNAAIYGRIWQVGTVVKRGNILEFEIQAI